MAAVLLDTDVFSYLLKGAGDNAARYRKHVTGKTVAVSFVTVGELYSGFIKKGVGQARYEALEARLQTIAIVPYDIEVCRAYGQLVTLKTETGSSRVMAGNDRWIAACAIRHNLPLVTNNRKHFDNIHGLTIITETPPPPPQAPGDLFGPA